MVVRLLNLAFFPILNNASTNSMLLNVLIVHSFLLLNIIPLYRYTTICLSIHLLAVYCLGILVIYEYAAKIILIQVAFCEEIFSFFLSKKLRVRLLGCKVKCMFIINCQTQIALF